MRTPKATHIRFPLTTQAGRVALLTGITAGVVTRTEVEAAVLVDTEKRPYRKPVVAFGRRFDSITQAAAFHCRNRASLNELKNMQQLIRRACNADNVYGFYWSE